CVFRWSRRCAHCFLVITVASCWGRAPRVVKIPNQGIEASAVQVGEWRHTSATRPDYIDDFGLSEPLSYDIDERRKRRRRSGQVLAMARQAMILVDRGARIFFVMTRDQHHRPRHVIGIDVEDSLDGIDGRPTPLGAAISS